MSASLWICPDCGEHIIITLNVTVTNNGRNIQLDGSGVRDHLDMHEQCYCHWVGVRAIFSGAAIAYQRHPDPRCPVHKEEDYLRALATHRLAAGLDVPIELIQDTPPEEKA